MQPDQRWVDLFQATGLPSAPESHMERWLRSQVPLTIGARHPSMMQLAKPAKQAGRDRRIADATRETLQPK